MKRAFLESDIPSCKDKVSQKRRRLSLPTDIDIAHCAAPTLTKWAGVIGWLRAVPLGASAQQEEARPTQQHHTCIIQESEIPIPLDSVLTMERCSRTPSSSPTRRAQKAQARKRSVSPTKKPGEYRSIFLSEAGVLIDREFIAPPAAPDLESLTIPPHVQAAIDDIARTYCDECREKAMTGAGEGDWRAHASVTVMTRLRRLECFASVLKVNASDKPWRAELVPIRATAISPRPIIPAPLIMSPMAVEKAPRLASMPSFDQSASFNSNVGPIVYRPIDSQPPNLESLDSDSLSYTSGRTSTTLATEPESLSIPKPDISVGLAHEWFPSHHQCTLNGLQTDPHSSAIGLHFPFLIFEAKGNASLLGAQNQAAVGAACMLRILDLVDYKNSVVWSVTTEGPIHELWVHYHDIKGKYQSIHMDTWRVTKLEHAKEFVEIMAKIMLWGSKTFAIRIAAALDHHIQPFDGS